MAAALHQRPDPRDVDAQHHGHPCHAFVATIPTSSVRRFIDRREQGNEAIERKVNLPDGLRQARRVSAPNVKQSVRAAPEGAGSCLLGGLPIDDWQPAFDLS